MNISVTSLPSDLSGYDTEQLSKLLQQYLEAGLKQYYAPLTDKRASGQVSGVIIAGIQRVSAELTSRFLLMRV